MLLGAFAELATIGSIIPFLALLSAPAAAAHLPWPVDLLVRMVPNSVIAAALLFMAFALLAGVMRLLLLWVTQDFIYRLANDLTLETHRRILFQPYSFHIEHNTSSLLSSVEMVEVLVLDVLLPLMQTLISGFTAAVILAGLLYLDPATTVIATVVFSAIYILISATSGKRLAENSAILGTDYRERIRIVQESLGGIRDVIVDHSQAMHLSAFGRINARLASARATNSFMAAAPRYVVEALGMVIIAAIVVLVSRSAGGIGLALPLLGAFALGAQRLLPLIQTVYNGWSMAAGHRSVVDQVVEMLRLPIVAESEVDGALPLRRAITLEGVSFAYPGRPDAPALSDINLEIPKGAMIALIGRTGAGKSTLADLIMALLQPVSGRICIDGVALTPANAGAWQQNIAHVPQSIFLADTTIARNIALAFGNHSVDLPRIVKSAEQAQLHEFVETLPQGYDTIVGERGIRLSGGQRQRLGLARVIYKQSPVLVLDEATSALDYETEAAVIRALDQLRREGRTIIVIAHRRSTIGHCNLVARLGHGRLVEFGPLSDETGVQQHVS
jgi:ABC-type multidrug transport system fused ATPase/permease subunit